MSISRCVCVWFGYLVKTKQFYLSQDEKKLGVPLELILAHCVLQSKLVSGVYFMFHYIGTKTKQRVSMSKKSKVCTGRGSCAHGGVYCFVCVTTGPVFDPPSSQSQSNTAKHSYQLDQIIQKFRKILILMTKKILKYQYFSTFLK